MALRIFPRVSTVLQTSGVVLRESRGLVAAFAPGLGAGTVDLVSGLPLAFSGGIIGVGGGTAGLVCRGNTTSANVVCPTWLKLNLPIEIVLRVSFLGTPTAGASYFGVTANNTGASPFLAYSIGTDASGFIRLEYNSAGTFRQHTGSVGYRRLASSLVGVPITIVGVFTTGGPTIYFGPDEGSFGSIVDSNPTYSATSLLTIGQPFAALDPNVCVEYGLIYNRALSPNELALFRSNPYHWVAGSTARQFAMGEVSAPASVEKSSLFVWTPM